MPTNGSSTPSAPGACGYLLKDSDNETIVAAIRGAVVGETRIDPAVAGKVLQEFNRWPP